MKILDLLLAFFALAVDDPEPGDPETPEEPAPEQPELAFETPETPQQSEPDHDEPARLLAEERAARAADRERADRFERELADLRARSAPVDEQTRAEEAVLRDPNTTELQKWQTQTNRSLRQRETQISFAIQQAQDTADRANFARLALTEPALYKRYEPRVEEEIAKARRNGATVKREDVYTYLLGQDMRAGKFTRKAPAAKKTAGEQTSIPRGKLPGARSDVSGKTAMSERDKRAKRLENQQI